MLVIDGSTWCQHTNFRRMSISSEIQRLRGRRGTEERTRSASRAASIGGRVLYFVSTFRGELVDEERFDKYRMLVGDPGAEARLGDQLSEKIEIGIG
jgi:hypothetical protein